MSNFSRWLLLIGFLGACTCGGRTSECNKNAQLSLLTSIHDDPGCGVISSRGVMTYEAAKFIIDAHNKKSTTTKIDLSVLDTCGTIDGAMKATMKALVLSNLNCLQAPHYLGIIGPESPTNVDAIQKMTSVLKIPLIVQNGQPSPPYLHHLGKESESYLVAGILEAIEALRWKSFTLVIRKQDNKKDDVQFIAKKLTMDAISRGICVMIHEEADDSFSSRIVYIGKPIEGFFKGINATVLVVSEGHLESYIKTIETTNSILLLEDTRNDFPGLETRVENSKWWTNKQGIGKYDSEELSEIRWLEDAIGIFTKALEVLCKKTKCTSETNPAEWNTILSTVIATYNAQLQIFPKTLALFLKANGEHLEQLGEITIKKTRAKLRWTNQDVKDTKEAESVDEIVPESFKELLLGVKETSTGCATSAKDIDDVNDITRILFDGTDDHEWWTMVAVVGGVGVVMFTVGILAVYVLISNIRGPKTPKNKSRRRIQRDFSLRRVSTDRQTQVVTATPSRENQRRDSNRSVISDKSV